MPCSPSEAVAASPLSSAEDEDRLLQDFCPDIGNLHMRKFDLSFKYQEAKFIEKSIMGHVPSVLQDMGAVELEGRLEARARRIDRSIRQVSREYQHRCQQRQRMGHLVTCSLPGQQVEEVGERRRRSKARPLARPASSLESETETELGDAMSRDLLKQQLLAPSAPCSREARIRSLQRYSPRLGATLLPLLEGGEGGGAGPWSSHNTDWKFQVSSEESVPPPAPEIRI